MAQGKYVVLVQHIRMLASINAKMKSKLFLLVSFISLNSALLAQQTNLSLEVAPNYSFRILKSNNNSISSKLTKNLLDSLESPLWGKRIFLNIMQELKQRFILSAGIGYKQIGTTITREFGYYNPNPDSFLGIDLNDYRTYKEVTKQKFDYVSFMIGVGKTFELKKNILFSPTIGTSIDYLIHRNFPEDDQWFKHPKLLGTLNVELRLSYQLPNRFSLFIAPIFEKQITPMRTIEYIHDDPSWNGEFDHKIKQYGYWLGANFGLQYSLKRS